MCARNKQMKSAALKSLLEFFPSLLSISVPEQVNEVVVGLPSTVPKDEVLSSTSPESEEDAELGCRVTVGGHVTECVLERVSVLTRWMRTYSGGELDADEWQSKVLGCLSQVNVYQQ